MKTLTLCLTCCVLLGALSARADVPAIKPKPVAEDAGKDKPNATVTTPAKVKIELAAAQTLTIPKKIFATLADDAKKGGALDDKRLRTIVAGIALALALTFSGLWFARRGQSGVVRHASVVVLALAMGLVAASSVHADKAVPSQPSKEVKLDADEKGIAASNLAIQVVDEGDQLTLKLDPGTARLLLKRYSKK